MLFTLTPLSCVAAISLSANRVYRQSIYSTLPGRPILVPREEKEEKSEVISHSIYVHINETCDKGPQPRGEGSNISHQRLSIKGVAGDTGRDGITITSSTTTTTLRHKHIWGLQPPSPDHHISPDIFWLQALKAAFEWVKTRNVGPKALIFHSSNVGLSNEEISLPMGTLICL